MHILFITSYFEPDQGATAVLLTRLAKQLQARGHQITVLTTLPNYPYGHILDGYKGKFNVVENRDGMRVIQTWLWATASPRISRKLMSQASFMFTAALRGMGIPRPDAALIEAQPIFTDLAGVFLSKIKRIPFVLNISDLWPDHLLTVGAMKATHPVYRVARGLVDFTYRQSAGIVAASPAWEKAIQGYIGPTNKTHVIYYGVDLNRFRPGLDTIAFRQKHNLGTYKLVTFIGTFATQYDFETLLSVASRFTDRSDVRFLFIGGGSQSEIMQQRLANGDLPNVQWMKWMDHAEIPLAWNASEVTFWALRNQDLYRGTIPAKLYEAMASGIPIVAATEDVAADLIRESGGGVATAFGDVDAMTEAIKRLLDDPAHRAACSAGGRRYAEQHFDGENIASAYERVLAGVMQR